MRAKKKTKAREGDAIPKQPKSAYMLYYLERCKQLKVDGGDKKQQNEVQRECGRLWKIITNEEKQPYVEKAKEQSRLYKEKKSSGKKSTNLASRTSCKTVIECISKFTPNQIDAVRSIGLGALLNLRCTRLDLTLCALLVKKFDPTDQSLTVHGRKVVLTALDVERIMGISSQGNDFKIEGSVNDIKELIEKYGFESGNLQINKLKEDIQSTQDDGDEFKVRFTLLALGCIFCPCMKPGVNQHFLHGLKDVSTLSNVNFGKLVLEYLSKGISNFKKKKQSGVSGCLVFFMLFYLNNFIPVGLPPSAMKTASYPAISNWGNEEISSRVRFLRKKGLFTKEKIALVETVECKEDVDVPEVNKETPPVQKVDEEGGANNLHTRMKKMENEIDEIKGDIRFLKDGMNSLQKELVHIVSLVNKFMARGKEEKEQEEQEKDEEEQHQHQQQQQQEEGEGLYSPLSVQEIGIRGDHEGGNGASPQPIDETPPPVDEFSSRPPVPKRRKYPAAKGAQNPLPLRQSPRKKAVRKREGEHSVNSKFPRTRLHDLRAPSKYRRSPYTAGTVKPRKKAVFEG